MNNNRSSDCRNDTGLLHRFALRNDRAADFASASSNDSAAMPATAPRNYVVPGGADRGSRPPRRTALSALGDIRNDIAAEPTFAHRSSAPTLTLKPKPSRYIPIKIKRIIKKEYGENCSTHSCSLETILIFFLSYQYPSHVPTPTQYPLFESSQPLFLL